MIPALQTLQQLGGNKFIAMTGSKNFYHTDDGRTLSMHLTKNKSKAKYLQITINDRDLYEMVFTTTVGKKFDETLIEVARFDGIYCDMLQSIFTQVTGLDTSL